MAFENKWSMIVKEETDDYNTDDQVDDIGLEDDAEDFSGGDDDLLNALKQLRESDDLEDDEEDEESDDESDDEEDEQDEEQDDEQADEEVDDEADDEKDDDEKSDEQKGKKRQQSKEENAKFAAERRRKEAEEKAKAELERLKQESPEFQLAKQLSELYGRPADQILAELKEAALQEEAKKQQVPVEMLRRQQQSDDKVNQLEEELNQLRFQSWQTQINADGENLLKEYKFLTQDDIDQAVDYILNVAKNVSIPLDQAVYAVHGKKIVENLANSKVQDELAQQSGRKKKTPPSPNNGKPKKVANLTQEERYVARQFGMSDEEYLEYKNQ